MLRPVLIIALVLCCLPASATAAPDIDPADLTAVDVDKPLGSQATGRAAKCRAGTAVASGGAYAHKETSSKPGSPALVSILSSFPDTEGNRWLARAGTPNTGFELRVRALCLPKRQLNGATTVTQTVGLATLATNGLTLACPGGEQVLSGGAFTHLVGQPFDRSLEFSVVSSSAPSSDALGWYASAWNNSAVTATELTVVAVCLPADRMGAVTVESKDVAITGQGQEPVARVKCGGKKQALAGGGYVHSGTGTPDPAFADNVRVAGSVPLQKGRRWHADAYSITNVIASLRTVALCLAP